jgi:hypothetical protein
VNDKPSGAVPSIEQLSRFSWHAADHKCRPEDGCQVVHKIWSTLRWLLKQGRPPAGDSFLEERIEALAARGGSRILICGGADTGLLEIVAASDRKLGFRPRVTFVDRCATPCAQNGLLAAGLPFTVDIVQQDILGYLEQSFDLVLAHNFLFFFSPGDQSRVLRRWADLLVPGAELSFVQNLLHDGTPRQQEPVQPALRELSQAARSAGFTSDETSELCQLAAQMWSTEPFPWIHRRWLTAALQAAGLETERCDLLQSERDTGSGPRGRFGADRYAICCRKPAQWGN